MEAVATEIIQPTQAKIFVVCCLVLYRKRLFDCWPILKTTPEDSGAPPGLGITVDSSCPSFIKTGS